MKFKLIQYSSLRQTTQKTNRTRLLLLPAIMFVGLFLPISAGILSAGADIEAPADSNKELPAATDSFEVLVSSLPTGTDNIDTPLTEYVTYTGRIDVAVGGKSFFEEILTDDFDVEVPACTSGNKPIIHGAYVEWYMRWRGQQSLVNVGANTPNFDPDLTIDINGNGDNTFGITDQYWARFDATNNRAFYRRNAVIDVTNQFDADWVAGTNNLDISGIVMPTPNESDPNVTNSEIYGVGIHVFFECAEFDFVKVAYNTGLDWFYELQDEPYAGDHSDLVCVEFPAVTATTQVDIDAIMSGQAQAGPPLRGARLFSQTGTGAPPTVDSSDAQGPADTIINGGDQIRTGFATVWTSSLGTEWDEVVEANAITLNPGDTWACIQAESVREPGSSVQGISGDILGVAFSIPLPNPTDWGDLPDGLYNTDSTGTPGPSHPIIPTLGIGPTIDDELDGQPNATATGDDNNGDDEDGVELPPAVKIGETAVFTGTATNQTGENAFLYAFVDWDGDGSFDGPNEVISVTVPTGSTDVEFPMTFTVPPGAAVDTDLGVRFRLSTDDDLGPDGPATNGEVEDYLYRLMPSNYDLALIKRLLSTGPFQLGDEVTYAILVMNQGGLNSGDFTVEDTLPADLSFVSASPNADSDPGVGNSGVVVWNDTDLDPGEIVTYTITAQITSVTTDTIKNTAEITADSGNDDDSDPTDNSEFDDDFNDDDVTNDSDPLDQDDSDFEEITVSEYDLALIKRIDTAGPYDVGDTITYTIEVMNQGNVNSGDYTVEDTLPVELAFVAASPAPNAIPAGASGGTIIWNATDLAAGEITSFTVSVQIVSPPAVPGPIKNTAEITADSGDDDDSDPTDNSENDDDFNDDDVTNDSDPDDQDDSDFEEITLAEYDLALIKRVDTPAPYVVGDTITYTIEVMNQGAGNSGDYTVEDTLPAELTFVSADPVPDSDPGAGNSGTIVWNSTDLAAGDIATYTVVVQIDSAPAVPGPIKNTAEITADSGNDDDSDPTDNSENDDDFNDDDVTNDSDPDDQDDSDFEEITLAEYDLALIKRVVTSGPYEVGDTITYTIEVMNQGEVNSGDYTVEDTLPAELTFVSADPVPDSDPGVGVSGTIVWNSTNLAAGDIATYTVVVQIAAEPPTGRVIKNTAEITADSGNDDDSDPTDDSENDDDFNDDDVTNDSDPDDEDDSDFEEITLAEYDLALIKRVVTTGPYQVGQTITYTIEVMNQGQVNSSDYTVEDTLPAELTFVSADPVPDADPGVGVSGTIVWNSTNLAAGDIATYTVVVQIDAAPATGRVIKNTAEITADSGNDDDSDPTDNSENDDDFNDDDVTNDSDPDDEDDSDFEEITLAEYDLALIKRVVSPGPYGIGGQVTYVIEVMNQGEINSGDYTVEDTLPAELSYVSASPTPDTVPASASGGTIVWNATDLAAGDTAVFTVTAQIESSPATGRVIKNTAEITADSGDDDDSDPTDNSEDDDDFNDDDVTNDSDPDDEDDSDFEEITLAEYDLALIKTVATTGPYLVGDQITYDIVVMNQGEINSGDYTVEDTLPAELSYVSANPLPDTAPAGATGGTIVWNATNLAAGDTVTFTVVVEIASAPANEGTIKNTAEITADSGDDDDSDPTDNSENDDDFNDDDVTNDSDPDDEDDSDFEEIVIGEYDLALIKRIVTPPTYTVGMTLTYDIIVMNQGDRNSGDFTVQDILPAQLLYQSASPTPTTAPDVGASGLVEWQATDLLPGDTMTFTVDVVIHSSAISTTVKNVAQISSDSGDDDDSDPTDDSGRSDTFNDDDVTNDEDDADEDDSDFESIFVDPPSAVELVKLNASRTGNREVTVSWQTASEIDNFGFEVYRSDNASFLGAQRIGNVPSSIANGTGPGANYSLIDSNIPGPGTYTYWLIDIDTEGVRTLHGPVTVTVSQGWQAYLPIVVRP